MARKNIDKAGVRNHLAPRREPYWGAPIARGLFLGFRKLEHGGTWVARLHDDDGNHRYHSLGYAETIPYEDAVKAARAWAKQHEAGVDTSEVRTVADACRVYVEDRRREVGDTNADDADGRFQRTVYSHALGKIALGKLRSHHIKDWRAGLQMAEASRNRTLSALKAALNLAVESRFVDGAAAIEWGRVMPYTVNTRRDLYLDRKQRAKLVDKLPESARPFVRALCLLPLRPGALAAAVAGDFDRKQRTLRVAKDKAGAGRIIALSADALALFKAESRGKLPAAPLIADVGGSAWTKEHWCEAIRTAAQAAKLPPQTCAYTLRHSLITDMIVGGIDPLTVARIAGTSLVMIQKHYGHLLRDHAATAMDALAL